jgi:hypothetical protein
MSAIGKIKMERPYDECRKDGRLQTAAEIRAAIVRLRIRVRSASKEQRAALAGQGILAQGKHQKKFGDAPPWVSIP